MPVDKAPNGFAVVEITVVSVIVVIIIAGMSTWYLKTQDSPDDEFTVESPRLVKSWPTTTPAIPTDTPREHTPIPTTTAIPTMQPTSIPSPTAVQKVPTATSIPPTRAPTQPTQTPIPPTPTIPSCYSNVSPTFSSPITDMASISYVVAPPTMGSGPNLKTHGYIGTNGARVPIYAPTAMTLSSGAYYMGGPYTLEFKASCEVTVRFGHVTEPVASILATLPQTPSTSSATSELTPISFATGELIAYTTGTSQAGNWDFGVYNSATSNRFASDPAWNTSSVYTTAVCPFTYFLPDIKTQYYAKFNSTILSGNPPYGDTFCQ
ncbi:hypothetical protein COY32_04620 [candidate division WWE3 bacterium CG_4_10_14_0_2_um_filter_41_14]|uniref:Uncharacterized protein n=1 Tax=candidate division WWE3 bacterium CG_4_10_14_0_2_um_filter_41_14 TaxID=1975072 RepID=A0A2M7TIG1_UNCKA|nr:MAG: hypothetical protein COY32_04620 [candidate division WWE3 bacterium CG_4_10_14_0_2_um_filter_41_14]